MQIKLNKRQRHVMWATVRRYVATAKPVGSEALLEEFNLNVSSATVRNAMGRLEKVGLLYQPHTSAGRVPSDLGYRTYVDHLLKPSDMGRQIEQGLSHQLGDGQGAAMKGHRRSLEARLRGAAQLLAQLSGYVALITFPERQSATLRHLQLVPMESSRVLLIVVLESYESESTVIELPSPEEMSPNDIEILEQELQILSNFLNHRLRGRSLGEISTLDWSELGRELERHANVLQASFADIERRAQRTSANHLLVSGLAEVLRRQPEFSEQQQLQMIVQLLEDGPDLLLPMICDIVESPTADGIGLGRRVAVRIGSENRLQPVQDCALVFTTYQFGETAVGSVGVLGPTRMMYDDAIAAVEATANHLSDATSDQR